jgi:transposase-like protein
LLVDGLWFRFHHKPWVLYLMALKLVGDNTAWLAEPLLLPGKESAVKWRQAIRMLPTDVLNTVNALVSDGFRGSKRLAVQYRWIHQRCHFHLLAQIQNRLGRKKRYLTDRHLRQAIYTSIYQSLATSAPFRLSRLLTALSTALKDPYCPRRFRMLGRDYLRNIDAFRAYLQHPELHLPTTTSAIESLFKSIRRFTRSLKSPESLSLWVKAFVRIHPLITCNGKNINQIT